MRADFDRREPRCRICRDETVRSLANELLDLRGIPIFLGRGRFHRITLTDIMRDLEPLNEGRDERHRITYVGLWNHCQRHYGCGIAAYWRPVVRSSRGLRIRVRTPIDSPRLALSTKKTDPFDLATCATGHLG